MDKDLSKPDLLEYATPSTKGPPGPTFIQESYWVAMGLGASIIVIGLVPLISAAQDGEFRMFWRDREQLKFVSISMGASLVLGGGLVWLGYRSGKGSRRAAYAVSGLFALFAAALGVGIFAFLTADLKGEDQGAAIFVALIFLIVLVACLFMSWAQIAWARSLRVQANGESNP